jgi:uncharacterized membrane protein
LGVITGGFISLIINDFNSLHIANLHTMIGGIVLVAAFGFILTIPCIVLFTCINFFWLSKEKRDSIKHFNNQSPDKE